MATVTPEKLIRLVEKSQLSEPAALQKALDEIRVECGGSLPDSTAELAKCLQKHKIITRWHAEKLVQGKYKGFFLGRHKLLGHIGSGGMSSVYLAEHTKMHDLRAIKVLPQSKLGKSSYLARFQQEAKAIASLNHPNIVRAHDIDNEGDTHYIVMEYVDGDDLQTIVKKHGQMDFEKVAEVITKVALGLQHAHDIGLIHRDVKPANVLISKKGEVKLLDLGLALFSDDTQASLTMDFNDKVLGTADYLAPEQALNSHQVDHRADLYGLGCTMYFLLTGHAPFPDGTIAQRIARHQKQMPKEIRKIRPECPGELEGICWKLLQKDPKFRYASAAQTAEVLQNWLVKYRAQKPVLIGGSSSVNLGDESETGSSASSKSASSIDTVSNRGSDTMGGKSGSSITNLSTSDSGVLVKVGSSVSGSDASSRVDLQAEIARRSRRGVSSAHGSSSAHGASQSPPSVSSTNQPSGPSGTFPPQVTNSPLPTATGPKFIWIIGLIFMFILAVLLGVVIARLTAPMGTPPAESTGNAMISSPGTEFRT